MSKGGRFLAAKPPKPEKKKTGVKVLLIVLAVILVICIAAGAYIISKINKINRAERAENQLTQEFIDSMMIEEEPTEATTAPTTEPTEPDPTEPDYGKLGKIVNVLVIGQDARPGEDSKNSDTMILLTVNKETKQLTMTSFLRDTIVYIPTFTDTYGTPHSGRTKLTLCYALGNQWGGSLGAMELMDNILDTNFGAKVDFNFEVDFDAFDAIINAIGGIIVDLDEDEVAYLEAEFAKYPDLGYTFNVGECKMDGWSAEVYARMRHATNADNDFNRTDRQRKVIAGVVEKLRHMSLSDLNNLIDTFLPMILTDMTNEDIANCVLELVPLLPELTMTSQQCPSEEMDRYGKLVDLFGDGVEHSCIYFTESKAKAIMEPITKGK